MRHSMVDLCLTWGASRRPGKLENPCCCHWVRPCPSGLWRLCSKAVRRGQRACEVCLYCSAASLAGFEEEQKLKRGMWAMDRPLDSTASEESYSLKNPFKIGHPHLFKQEGACLQCPLSFSWRRVGVTSLCLLEYLSSLWGLPSGPFSHLSAPHCCHSALILPHLDFPLNTKMSYITVSVNSVVLYANTVNICKYMLCIKLSFLNTLKVTLVSYLAFKVLQAWGVLGFTNALRYTQLVCILQWKFRLKYCSLYHYIITLQYLKSQQLVMAVQGNFLFLWDCFFY